jgi:hypothetical protein
MFNAMTFKKMLKFLVIFEEYSLEIPERGT